MKGILEKAVDAGIKRERSMKDYWYKKGVKIGIEFGMRRGIKIGYDLRIK